MADIRKALKDEIARLKSKTAKLEKALAVIESADGPRVKKFTMSADAKARISAAQKKRWKAIKAKQASA
jgi:hypothetical protein